MFVAHDTDPGYKIDAIVQRVASDNGAEVIRNLRLEVTGPPVDYSYVLVSRHGLLVVDIDLWPRAEIRGSSSGKKWTAKVKGLRRQRFENPLLENVRRIAALKDSLVAYGVRLPDEYFADFVVLYGAEISRLNIGELERCRTTNGIELENALRGHYDFAVNPGTVEPAEVRDIASMLRSADTSDLAREAGLPADDELSRRVRAELAPVAPRLSQDRYPQIETPAAKRRTSSGVLLLVLLAALLVWLFLFGGQRIVTDFLTEVLIPPSHEASQPERVPVRNASVSGLEEAQRILEETSPETYAQVIDLDSPEVLQIEEYTTFTWHFVDDQGQERWISLTFDPNGQLTGVTNP